MTFVILVNEKDHPIGIEEKLKAHRNGLLHRAFSVMLYRQSKTGIEILLQKRSMTKYHCRGLWSNTCCSHPEPGEAVSAAAHRRLAEELGVCDVHLMLINKFHYIAKLDNGLTENEIDYVFVGEYTSENLTIDSDEISEVRWVLIPVVIHDMIQNPENYTPWLGKVMDLMTGDCKI